MKLIQDWTPYNDSLLFKSSDEYFKNSGKEAFSNEGKSKKHVVPNELTNCIAHARSIAVFVRENLRNYPADQKIKILEVGSGSGIFARHFLMCMQELQLLHRVEYLVSEYSRVGLEHMQASGVLDGFEENKHYRFVHLDLLNPSDSKLLNGEAYQVENISVSIMNYIACVLPMTLLCRDLESGHLQELNLRLYEKPNVEYDLDYLENLHQEWSWQDYDPMIESDLEKKYANFLDRHLKSCDPGDYIYYAYGTLEVIKNLLSFTDDNGFIFVADMPRITQAKDPYKIYANSIAHPVNDGLIVQYASDQGAELVRSADLHYILMRMFIFKNTNSLEMFKNLFQQEYLDKNDANLLIELRILISQFTSKYSAKLMKQLIDQMLVIDNVSYESQLLLARYYFLSGEIDRAKDAYVRASELDFLGNMDVYGGSLKQLLELELG